MHPAPTETCLHGSAVQLEGFGILITGDPGSGKSTLVLGLIAQHGATLIADDQVIVQRNGTQLLLASPPPLAGLLEVRTLGLVRMPHTVTPIPLTLIIRLAAAATIERFPQHPPGTPPEILLGLPIPRVTLAAQAALTPLLVQMALHIVTGQREVVYDIHT
jgi:HPr kinase/phosphorylase